MKIRWDFCFLLSSCLLFLILLFGCQKQKADSESSVENILLDDTTNTNIEYLEQSKGSINGRVVYEGSIPIPQKLLVVKDVDICGRTDHYDKRLRIGKHNGIQNAVVSLTNIRNGKSLDVMGTEFVLSQEGCEYLPHVLVVPVNTPIQILNNDGILHNIHTFSKKNRPVNLAQPKFKKKLEMVFKQPEKVSVKCDVHGWMSAWIVVVNHSYYAVTDADGGFTLDDIPTGTYTVSCWQELLGEQIAQVNIEASASVTLDFKYHSQE